MGLFSSVCFILLVICPCAVFFVFRYFLCLVIRFSSAFFYSQVCLVNAHHLMDLFPPFVLVHCRIILFSVYWVPSPCSQCFPMSLCILFFPSVIDSFHFILACCCISLLDLVIWLKNKNRLRLLAKTARKISVHWKDRLLDIHNKHVLQKVYFIINCFNHPLHIELDFCPLAIILEYLWGGPKDSRSLSFLLQPIP